MSAAKLFFVTVPDGGGQHFVIAPSQRPAQRLISKMLGAEMSQIVVHPVRGQPANKLLDAVGKLPPGDGQMCLIELILHGACFAPPSVLAQVGFDVPALGYFAPSRRYVGQA